MSNPWRRERPRIGVIAAALAALIAVIAVIVVVATRKTCTPLASRACPCAGGRSGVEICAASGRAYSPCLCAPSGSTASASDAGAAHDVAVVAPVVDAGDAGALANALDGSSGAVAGSAVAGGDGGARAANGAGAGPSAGDAGAGRAGAAASGEGDAGNTAAGASNGADGGAPGALRADTDAGGSGGAGRADPSAANGAGADVARPAGGPAPRYCSAWSGVAGTCSRCVVNFSFANARPPRDVFVGACDRMPRGPVAVQLLAITSSTRASGTTAEIDWDLAVNDATVLELREGVRPTGAARSGRGRVADFRGGALRMRVRLSRCTTSEDTTCSGNGSLVVSAGP